MGSNAITTITIGLALLLAAVYFRDDASVPINNILLKLGVPDDYLKIIFSNVNKGNEKPASGDLNLKSKSLKTFLTAEELKKYDGGPDSKGLYLAILGEIFDVEKGAQHYRPGGGYAFFSGRDATRAYITGDFSENGLVDNILDLSDSSLASIEDWLSFYRDEYKSVGYVIGRYYNENAEPTQELLTIKEKMNQAKKSKYAEEKDRENFPPCNSEWSKEKGSKVWCTKKSGGVERVWVGVPRQLHKKGKDPRCVCVKNYGPSTSDPDSPDHNDRGDLDHPDLKEYPGCPASADTCSVDHP